MHTMVCMKVSNGVSSELGSVISKLRRELQLSQEELASISGLHRTYVSLLERGCKSPTVATLEGIAQALGVPMSRLIVLAEQSRSTKEGNEDGA